MANFLILGFTLTLIYFILYISTICRLHWRLKENYLVAASLLILFIGVLSIYCCLCWMILCAMLLQKELYRFWSTNFARLVWYKVSLYQTWILFSILYVDSIIYIAVLIELFSILNLFVLLTNRSVIYSTYLWVYYSVHLFSSIILYLGVSILLSTATNSFGILFVYSSNYNLRVTITSIMNLVLICKLYSIFVYNFLSSIYLTVEFSILVYLLSIYPPLAFSIYYNLTINLSTYTLILKLSILQSITSLLIISTLASTLLIFLYSTLISNSIFYLTVTFSQFSNNSTIYFYIIIYSINIYSLLKFFQLVSSITTLHNQFSIKSKTFLNSLYSLNLIYSLIHTQLIISIGALPLSINFFIKFNWILSSIINSLFITPLALFSSFVILYILYINLIVSSCSVWSLSISIYSVTISSTPLGFICRIIILYLILTFDLLGVSTTII